MKKALAIGLAAAMAVSMTAPVYASDDSESGAGIAKEDHQDWCDLYRR